MIASGYGVSSIMTVLQLYSFHYRLMLEYYTAYYSCFQSSAEYGKLWLGMKECFGNVFVSFLGKFAILELGEYTDRYSKIKNKGDYHHERI